MLAPRAEPRCAATLEFPLVACLRDSVLAEPAVMPQRERERALRPAMADHLVAMIRSLQYPQLVSTNARVDFEIEVPGDLARLHLPEGLDRRLQTLLDKQDGGTALSADEQAEAEGLVDLADLLTLLRLRSSKSHPAPG
jgi:hypothetical protein